jgi:Flp pilus assembly protein TadD
MSRFSSIQRLFGAATCAVALTACGTAAIKKPELPLPPPVEQTLAKASEASTAGNKEQALTLLKEANSAYPDDKTPLLEMAQIKYDGGQYGEAILDAQQALSRDPTDTRANSIIAISGLRLSTAALADLARQKNLSKNVRTESEDLAKLLRESLKEEVLIPTPPAKPQPRQRARVVRKVAPKAAEAADPFGALK